MADPFERKSGDQQHPEHGIPEQAGNAERFENDSGQPSSDGYEGQPPRRRFAAWMVLVPILIIVIGLYASDVLRGRMPQERVFERIQDILPRPQTPELQIPGASGGGRQQESESPPKIISADEVHKLIGREPDSVEKAKETINDAIEPVFIETYHFPGIIESYNVIVTYLLDDSVKDQPMTALKYVRKQYGAR